MGITPSILEDDDKGRAYLRGAFLATGTIRDPESGKYQLEIFSVYQDHAEDLANLMRKFILDAKVIEHKNGAVTYLQKAEDMGITFKVNPELEFFLFGCDDSGNPVPETKETAGYFDVAPADMGENVRRDIILNLEDMNFNISETKMFQLKT